MVRVRGLVTGWLVLGGMLLCAAAQGKGSGEGTNRTGWLQRVTSEERGRRNPFEGDANAGAAGAILYRQSCASCHGREGRGAGRRPSLRTARVQEATDGELHWLLTNGSMAHGMPSWSRLPDEQRWQLARYLHTLGVDETK